MLSRLKSVGIDPIAESFSFAECVHRSQLRYDLSIDARRTPPDAPWEQLSASAAKLITPILEGLPSEAPSGSRYACAAEGLITSLPGAVAQRFHIDGEREGSFNAIVPLVPVEGEASGVGTEFWLGSHREPKVKDLISQKKLAVDDASLLPAASTSIVKPALAAFDMLLYDYRIVHRGPANPGPSDRPVFYTAWADVASSDGDGYNFPRRSLAELERRSDLFGPLLNLRGGAMTSAAAYAPGDVVAIHHAFAASSGGSSLRGFFRTLPSDDGESVYLGPCLLEPSAEPNCVLAPSADGGCTRRVLALEPIAAGEPHRVPFAFDMDNHAERIEHAITLSSAAAGLQPSHDKEAAVVRDAGGGKGRGVFSTRGYEKGELVASWPCRSVPDGDVPTGLVDCAYTAPKPGFSLIVLGLGSLYNHGEGDKSNIEWSVPTDAHLLLTNEGEVKFYARRKIEAGEELLASYSSEYWASRGIVPE